MKPSREMLAARVSMFLAATFMGSVGLFVSHLTKGLGMQVFAAVEFRGLFGVAWVTAILLATKRLGVVKALLGHGRLVVAVTATTVLTVFFYFLTIDTAGLAIAAFLLYAGNLVAVLLMRVFLKEPMPRATYVAYGLAIAGVLVMEPWGDASLTWGVATGICSAVSLGFINLSKKLIFQKERERASAGGLGGRGGPTPTPIPIPVPALSLGITWYATLGLAATFAFAWAIDGQAMCAPDAIVPAVFLGLVPTALAFTFFNYALKSDTGGNVLIISYAEPVMASIFQLAFFGGIPIPVWIGGALIIAGNVVVLRARGISPGGIQGGPDAT
ncbi:MAG: EamA family transporter [Candidatus Lokiarchaeota archaeon]|nr:EamA family transporter [Candidatus Lokiarchaeota archaeon]